MKNEGPPCVSIDRHALASERTVHRNLSPARLRETAVLRGEAKLASEGPPVCLTGSHTGRSPQDKFVVGDAAIDSEIWWGEVNRRFERERYEALWNRVRQYLADRDLFVFDGYAGAGPRYRLPVRVVTELAWHNLFARNMFLRESDSSRLAAFEPGMTVVNAALFHADPGRDGTRASTFILLDLARRMVLIGGTRYAGEIKKSVFSVMNYLLPGQQVMPMHCSANYGATRDDVTLFFDLSGTGKTTLSADPGRTLIGDDEHGWSADGVFNVEGGCYAKVIRLSREGEPEIYETTRRFGTVLENVVCDEESRELDLDADTLTENTRSSYPLTQLESVDLGGSAGHPKHVVFLTCDALGRLTPDQAMYHFLSGYTARVAGTERGITDSEVTLSSCCASPFLPPSRSLRRTSRRALAPPPRALLAGQHRLDRRTLPTWQATSGGFHPPHCARGAKRRALRPSTEKARGAKRRVAEGERGGRGRPPAKPPELARTSVGAWGFALIGLLVIAFTAYGMIIGDHELLGKIWSLISGAVGAIMAWLGLRRA